MNSESGNRCEGCGEPFTKERPYAMILAFELPPSLQLRWHAECLPAILAAVRDLPDSQRGALFGEVEKWLQEHFGRSM